MMRELRTVQTIQVVDKIRSKNLHDIIDTCAHSHAHQLLRIRSRNRSKRISRKILFRCMGFLSFVGSSDFSAPPFEFPARKISPDKPRANIQGFKLLILSDWTRNFEKLWWITNEISYNEINCRVFCINYINKHDTHRWCESN